MISGAGNGNGIDSPAMFAMAMQYEEMCSAVYAMAQICNGSDENGKAMAERRSA